MREFLLKLVKDKRRWLQWLFVPAQVFTRHWLKSFEEFPPLGGTTLGIYGVLKQVSYPAASQ